MIRIKTEGVAAINGDCVIDEMVEVDLPADVVTFGPALFEIDTE